MVSGIYKLVEVHEEICIMFTITFAVFGFIVYAACVIIPSVLDELVNSY